MNTTAHAIFGAAIFGRPEARRTLSAAIAGSLAPDISLYVMVGWQRWVEARSFTQIFKEDYGDPFWQGVFAIDNSIPLWALLFAVALAARRAPAAAFAGAGLIHVCIDLLLHNNDARRQFWPLSDRVFHSPLSYWDPAHHGEIVAALVLIACIGLSLLIWKRFPGRVARGAVAILMLLEAAPAILFPFLFASH